jgi:hypothetical protein
MEKLAVRMAALAISAFGTGAANAQSMTLASPDIKEGGTIANERCSRALAARGTTSPRR